jgi:hypothetical protein
MARNRLTTIFRGTLATACGSALALSGCGGGAGSVTSGGATSARGGQSFVAQADAICREAHRVGGALRAPRSEAELAPYFARALTLGQDEIEKLSALHPPSERAAAYRIWLTGLEQALGSVRATDEAARAGNISQVQALVREGAGLTQRNVIHARAVGIPACAKEG